MSGRISKVEPESIETYVVYDAETGDIFHVHRVVILKGGAPISHGEEEKHALSLARKRRPFAGNLAVLRVQHESLQQGLVYAVDLQTRSLVAKGRPRTAANRS
jgi:hypothetical protein